MNRKAPPACLLALGREAVPARLTLRAGDYRLEQVFKHDFFAATALYAGERGRVVLKIGRKADFLGLPLDWIGRLHAWHESSAYQELADLPAVPQYVDRFGAFGFVHEYVDGHPLGRGEQVRDDFFDLLRQSIGFIHQRGMAYVDLEKCENVIVGDDGRPYLVDFQIAWRVPRRWGDRWPLTWIRSRLQRADRYHLLKLQRRCRPDQLSEEQLRASYRKPGSLRMHGFISRPFIHLRRKILAKLDPRRSKRERGRIHPPPETS
jgi:hypothetical protein